MFKILKTINFIKYFKTFNIMSLIFILLSLGALLFKGLNYGVDFKGGTIIELRTLNQNIKIQDIRKAFLSIDVGDVSVKKFGKDTDYLIKFEKKNNNDSNLINQIKIDLNKSIGSGFKFRRVET